MQDMSQILDLISKAALEAGEAILEIYNSPISATKKPDGTPVTIADQKAEAIILKYLEKTKIPVLAEESAAAGNIPELGDRFFVVDPLDGTKEFIKKNDEFTVNIALVENGKPVCGIVTAPALKQGFIGSRQKGAFQFTINGRKIEAETKIDVCSNGPLNIISSRSHKAPMPDRLSKYFGECEESTIGSSLKFCLLAIGKARIYPRFSPTSEWDTAAGQAVLEAAGGVVLTVEGAALSYGKAEKKFINPNFIAADCRDISEEILQILIHE
ncbi:3'(2'),5'-bisphosphate nucleotidase [hydrothermal vent metagenome]|uniref:3'-phosphoadenosine 5'-phosphate phosphatase n=1 Tax=hydrothermal vent metagenome TaxID=652676 RepID=A0A3B0U8Q9_9ZZZZ